MSEPTITYVRVQPASYLAIASCVLSFFGAGIFGVICGHMALKRIRNAPPPGLSGKGAALIGLVVGYVEIAVLAFFILKFA